ncbi:MAG: response regulator [Acetobacteraceae bacterium]|jgi:CheY-like chemotaxis protein
MSSADHSTGIAQAVSETILVIDPDILVRMVIAGYLRECGYAVIEAVSVEEALIVLTSGKPVHVVLAEVSLHGAMDGFALAQHVRQHFRNVDVILTGSATSTANKAHDLCDDGPLHKPYHPKEIVRRLNLLREQRRVPQPPPARSPPE